MEERQSISWEPTPPGHSITTKSDLIDFGIFRLFERKQPPSYWKLKNIRILQALLDSIPIKQIMEKKFEVAVFHEIKHGKPK